MTTAPLTTPTTLTAARLRERVDADAALVIDVRTPGEFHAQHIAGSRNIPLDQLKADIEGHADRLRADASRTVLVCASGARARDAQRHLAAAGLPEVAVLAGGVGDYGRAGGAVERQGSTWAMERQVRMAAGSLVLLGAVATRALSPRFLLLPGAIGAGLTFSALSDTCAMGSVLARMPWNRAPGGAAGSALHADAGASCPVERAQARRP